MKFFLEAGMGNQSTSGAADDQRPAYALVTGGSRGIGLAVAMYLAGKGLNLLLLAQDPARLARARARILERYPDCRVELLSVDMRFPHQVHEAVVKALSGPMRITTLVNSAGVLKMGGSALAAEEVISMVDINLTSALVVTNLVADRMRRDGGGQIFLLSSMAGLESLPKLGIYAATKAALISYAQALHKELLPHDVRLTCLCPSVVNTDMTDDGRIPNEAKIQVEDVVATIDFVLGLPAAVMLPQVEMRCKVIEMEKFAAGAGAPAKPGSN
jgi:short-subunit dehydrogenase